MGSTIGQLKVRLDAEIKAFQEKFASATKQMQKFQRSAQSIGRSLTTSLTLPIVGTGVAALAQAKRLDELTQLADVMVSHIKHGWGDSGVTGKYHEWQGKCIAEDAIDKATNALKGGEG